VTTKSSMSSSLSAVAAYLERLPHGIDSYPQATVKGSVVRAVIGDTGPSSLPVALIPPSTEELVRNPPGVSDWVRETHHGALLSAIFDTRFRGAGGIPAFDVWAIERNRTLLRGPLYRVMFLVLSPERILIGVQQRWAAFHRGSLLNVVKRAERAAQVRLTYPAFLFAEHALRWFACAFQVAVEAAGAKNAHVRADVESETSTLFDAQWDT